MTRYGFRQALGGLFVGEYGALQSVMPAGLWPLEAQTGFGVLAVTAFDFDESEVGAYGELVFSVLARPWAPKGQPLPDAAYFPFFLATTTEASRTHAAERWHLPAHDTCLDIVLGAHDGERSVTVSDGDTPVLRLTVSRTGAPVSLRRYLCFSEGDGQLLRVGIDIRGELDEHEEETGFLELLDHPVAALLVDRIEDEVPFREHSMERGEQQFGLLTAHNASSL